MRKTLQQIKQGWYLSLVIFAEWVDLMAYTPSKYHQNYFWSELTEQWICFTLDAFEK